MPVRALIRGVHRPARRYPRGTYLPTYLPTYAPGNPGRVPYRPTLLCKLHSPQPSVAIHGKLHGASALSAPA